MAQPNNKRSRSSLPNIDISSDAEGNQYIRSHIRPFAPVSLFGRLGSDVEISHVGTDSKVRGVFYLAVDWQDYGQEERTVAWMRITAWGGAAEALARTVKKGDQIGITVEGWTSLVVVDSKGRIQVNDAGTPRIIMEATVDNFRLMSNPRRNPERNTTLNVEDEEEFEDKSIEDIPF